MNYIAHIKSSDGIEQLLQDHLLDSKKIAENLGKKIAIPHLTGLAGLLHDLGKYSNDFQNYLRKAVNDPGSVKRGSVDHSTAGGKLLYNKFHQQNNTQLERIIAEIVGNAIISHHSGKGLQDFLSPESIESDYLKRVMEKEIPDFDKICSRFFEEVMTEKEFDLYVKEAAVELLNYLKKNTQFRSIAELNWFFLTKFVYSCLIDADRTNTMLFEENKESTFSPKRKTLFSDYYTTLTDHIAGFSKDQENPSKINQLRAEMSKQCDDFAERDEGIYTLSIPTGGGKTLASLRFALKHAVKHNKKRIIYVVPFTTIIEQNAATVRKILHDDVNILEHHSNVVEENVSEKAEEIDSLNDYVQNKTVRLTKDNWDSPIIFTTMVQFLNIIYAKGTRNVRRFHNLADAVIIFDEVQSVPTKCITLFNAALNYLKYYMRTSSILCTATQPSLGQIENNLKMEKNSEMIQNLTEVAKAFKRVRMVNKVENSGWSITQLNDFTEQLISEKKSILIILNTKPAVRKAFEEMEERGVNKKNLYHLSTSMCAAHRKEILDEIRDKLKNGERIICFTSQLIEAGVDISFSCVIRSLAGLDSIAQAAGRCNRNGEADLEDVYIVKLAKDVEKLSRLKEIKIGQEKTEEILNIINKDDSAFDGDLLSPMAMSYYFESYFSELELLLNYNIPSLQEDLFAFIGSNVALKNAYRNRNGKELSLYLAESFKTVGKYFEVIDSPTTAVVVPYKKDGKELIADLNGELSIEELSAVLKKAQQFSVNLYQYQLDELAANDLLYPLYNGQIFALDDKAYSEEYGVTIEGEGENSLMAY